MSTRWPSACSFGRMRSRSSNLPELRQSRFVSSPSCSSCSGEKKRYGWLQTLRSCISTLLRPDTLSCPAAPTEQRPWSWIWRYMSFCIGDSSHLTTYSALSGSCASTSDLSRRSRKGRSTWCSRLMTRSDSSSFIAISSCADAPPARSASGAENHVSNESAEAKIFGSRKLSSAQSSCRLFWRGVPVSSSLRCALTLRSRSYSAVRSFLMRCPSSSTR
mmetsp:Transcript_11045/g.35159  ORF Transcript_11045/g.35159 Transcript_11045/m.35159 type:complete len:218 (+) Transcript_11045:2425-3078(+)